MKDIKCKCEDITCKNNCFSKHTHKTFWCEKCKPEDTNKIDLKKAGKDFAKRFTGVMSRLAGEDTNTFTLREEQNLFKEWLNSGATNFPEDGYDWWLDKFNQKLEEIEQEIGELETIKGSITNGFKIVVLQIIKNKKN